MKYVSANLRKIMANNPIQSRFQKYIILSPADYENLLRLKVEIKHLNDSEKAMIKVLKENKLTPHQRFKKYQQILFKSLLKRVSTRNEKEATPFHMPLAPSGYPLADAPSGYPLSSVASQDGIMPKAPKRK